jgi:hypothetical protein
MLVRDFLGFQSLKEVECSGRNLPEEIDFMSVTMFRVSDSSVLGTLKTLKNDCQTYSEYASCVIDSGDSRKSAVRTLVADLEEEQTKLFGCNVSVIMKNGHARMYSWSISVYRESKICFWNFVLGKQ